MIFSWSVSGDSLLHYSVLAIISDSRPWRSGGFVGISVLTFSLSRWPLLFVSSSLMRSPGGGAGRGTMTGSGGGFFVLMCVWDLSVTGLEGCLLYYPLSIEFLLIFSW